MGRTLAAVRERWRLVLVCAVLGAGLGYAALGRQEGGYTARALVVATDPTVPSDQVGSVLQAIFATDAVLDATASDLNVAGTGDVLVRSGVLEVEPGTSELAVNLVGRATDAAFAAAVANASAENLADVAEENGFGTFAVFPWNGDGVRPPGRLATAAAAGAALGAVLAALALATIEALRPRPAGAEDLAYADVVYRLTVAPGATDGESDGEAEAVIDPPFAVRSLRRAVAEGVAGGRVETVVVPTESTASWACAAVARRLDHRGPAGDAEPRGGPKRSDERSSAARPRIVALVAAYDTPLPRLLEARTKLGEDGDPFVVLVLVRAAS
jgi:hypothetical protein